MEGKVVSGIAWASIAIIWVVVFAPVIIDLIYAGGYNLGWAEEDLITYFPALIVGILAIRDFHKGGVF